MRVYLLRHGETDWNRVRRLQGRIDTPLNANGISQSRRWRPFFDTIRLDAIYSSALDRALHTTVLACGRPGCIAPGFNERGFGAWEGRTRDELRNGDPEFDEKWKANSFRPSGGESRSDLYERVRQALSETVLEHPDGAEVLVVSHGASGHGILVSLLGFTIEQRKALPLLDNASLTILQSNGSEWRLAEHRLVPDGMPV